MTTSSTALPLLVYHPLLLNAPPAALNSVQLALLPYVPIISALYWGLYVGMLVYLGVRFVAQPLWQQMQQIWKKKTHR